MTTKSIKRAVALGCAVAFTGLPLTSFAAETIHSGWDLLWTDPVGTTFIGQNWQGVTLGSYDFGGSIGMKPVGGTDTIVHRLATATAPVSIIPIEMAALQLQSVSPFDMGAGLNYHYITLQSVRGGPLSSGNMTITFGPEGNPHGTFGSLLDVYFDIRFGALNGPIIFSDHLPLTSGGTPWGHDAPPEASPLIEGVNYRLNGIDTMADFWPGLIVEQHPSGAQHTVMPAPEPGASLLLLLGVVLLGALRLGKKLRQA